VQRGISASDSLRDSSPYISQGQLRVTGVYMSSISLVGMEHGRRHQRLLM
jgi:hypothetical protein